MKVKKGDNVKILSGKDKGKQAEVLMVLPAKSKVVVKGVNILAKNFKKSGNREAGIVRMEAPIHVSNVQVINPETGKPSRIGFKLDNDAKVKVFKGNTQTRKATTKKSVTETKTETKKAKTTKTTKSKTNKK